MESRDAALAFARSAVWAIETRALTAIMDALERPGTDAASAAVSRSRGAQRPPLGSVAVIPIMGPITHRPSFFSMFFGGSTVVEIQRDLREALSARSVEHIVLMVDSPGGTVDGIPELGDELHRAAANKPLTAVVDTMAASAAFWLASQASEVVVTPSGEVGSIGVFMQHLDHSGALEKMGVKNTFIFAGDRKVDGNPLSPLSKTARSDLQARVDTIHRDFLAAVGRGRGVPADYAKATYGDGRLFDARQALRLGLADRVATLDDVLSRPPSSAARSRGALVQAQADRDLLDLCLGDMERVARADPLSEADAAAGEIDELTSWLVEHPAR